MISIDFGCLASDIASLDEMMTLPSKSAPGKRPGPGSRGDDDRLGRDLFIADLDLMRSDHLRDAKLGRDLVLAKQSLDALVELPGDGPAAADHLAKIPVALAVVAKPLAVSS